MEWDSDRTVATELNLRLYGVSEVLLERERERKKKTEQNSLSE